MGVDGERYIQDIYKITLNEFSPTITTYRPFGNCTRVSPLTTPRFLYILPLNVAI